MAIECNVGGKDRIARIGLGAALLGTGIASKISAPIRIAAGVLGTAGLITGLIKYCPVSRAVGLNTCHKVDADEVARSGNSV